MTVNDTQVAARLADVRARIRAAGADPDAVKVVAVTKGFGVEAVEAAVAAGLTDIGENYAQELIEKHGAVGARVRWHFLGSIQRNKVRRLAPMVDVWQSIDRVAAGRAVAAQAPGARVLVEVNTSGEASKGGCRPAEAAQLVDALGTMGLDVDGLMTVGPAGPAEGTRPGFAELAALARRLGLAELSMGMSNDLEVAVQEGATMVRIGTALFGPRPGSQATIG